MMDFIYSLMVLVHILLLVFWVGTDVGVFLAAKVSERTDLSIETRSTVLSVCMVLDRHDQAGGGGRRAHQERHLDEDQQGQLQLGQFGS